MDDRFEQLRSEAARLMEQYSVPGMTLGMLIDGVEHTASLGVTSLENPLEVTDDTLFQIGSITKTVTATALARLADEGRLSLDDPVRAHVPGLALVDEGVAESITVRQTLNHTAGFAGDLFTNTGTGDDNLAIYIEGLRDLPQLLPPGTFAVYNNAAFSLAGHIIERVTALTYEQAATSLVLEPLELTNTRFDPAVVMLKRFAVGHIIHPDGLVEVATPWGLPRAAMAAGGLASSITDQLRYARFHMGDGSTGDSLRLLSERAMTEMQTPAAEFNDGQWIGLSWMISDLDGVRVVAHTGATNGQMSTFWMCPDIGLAFVSMTNGSNGKLLNNELTALARRLFLGYEPPTFAPLAIDDPAPYIGRYIEEPQKAVHEVSLEDDQLRFRTIDQGKTRETFKHPDAVPSTIEFRDADEFVFKGGDLHGGVGTFLRGEAGEVTHIRMSRLLIKEG